MNENSRLTLLFVTAIEYFPLISVIAPEVVPETTTFTPVRGSPLVLSVTIPVIFCCCNICLGAITIRLLSKAL